MSQRVRDANGYVTVKGNPITREGVYQYLGSEIPGYEGNPDDLVNVYRPAEELCKPETLESFKLLPFIIEHTWVGIEGVDAAELDMTGCIGEEVYFEEGYIKGTIRWFSQVVQAALDSGIVELSPGYTWDVYKQSGVFEGVPYNYVQRNLRGNHLALVEVGRTGYNVRVMDQKPTGGIMTLEEILKAIAKLDKVQLAALMAGIKAAGGEDDAAAVDEDPTKATDVDPNAAADPEDPNQGQAMDEDGKAQDEDAKAMDENGKATDESAKACDQAALMNEVKALRKQVQAMDAGTLLKELDSRNKLAEGLAVHIGAFACDSMTTQKVAEYGATKLGLKVAKGQEIAAVQGYLAAAGKVPAKAFTFDSKPTQESAMAKAIDDL